MRIAFHFDLPTSITTMPAAQEAVGKLIASITNHADGDIVLDVLIRADMHHRPVPLFPNQVILEGEINRLAREAECRRLASLAGWVQADGKVFDGMQFKTLAEAENHPDSVIYDGWSECCDGEGLNPLRGLAIPESTTAPDPSPGDDHAAPAASFEPILSLADAQPNEIPGTRKREIGRLVPRTEPEVTNYPGEDVPEGYMIVFVNEHRMYSFRRPDGELHYTLYGSKSAAIEDAKLDPSGGRGDDAVDEVAETVDETVDKGDADPAEPFEKVNPTDVATVFGASIDAAFDHLLADVPNWRSHFNPLKASKGKKAVEDLVGLLTAIRAELTSQTSKNVTN